MYREACFSLKNFYKLAKLFKECQNSTHGQDRPDSPPMNSVNFLILPDRIFLNNWEFQWVQHTKLCKMTLPFLRSVVVGFHQNNARLHSTARTVETISQFGWEQLLHPPYSSDLDTPDFHLFDLLKNFTLTMKWRALETNGQNLNSKISLVKDYKSLFFNAKHVF